MINSCLFVRIRMSLNSSYSMSAEPSFYGEERRADALIAFPYSLSRGRNQSLHHRRVPPATFFLEHAACALHDPTRT